MILRRSRSSVEILPFWKLTKYSCLLFLPVAEEGTGLIAIRNLSVGELVDLGWEYLEDSGMEHFQQYEAVSIIAFSNCNPINDTLTRHNRKLQA